MNRDNLYTLQALRVYSPLYAEVKYLLLNDYVFLKLSLRFYHASWRNAPEKKP